MLSFAKQNSRQNSTTSAAMWQKMTLFLYHKSSPPTGKSSAKIWTGRKNVQYLRIENKRRTMPGETYTEHTAYYGVG